MRQRQWRRGALLTQIACDASAGAQRFRVVAQNGAYGLVNVGSGRCVDVPGYSTGPASSCGSGRAV
ncbi:RICIN domain-containing protein [Nonomuraea sp. C10]|uniref:RICIN domain-containing protein n=1 Tax=Nonomuraea sp. C10 TaxID=2600577 RepID=UPI001C9C2DD8|nr:RICIN domain-containing protein [Nonomuraea sp. C10]